MNNFNKRFKDVALKNFQDKIWQEPSGCKFDTIYDDMVDRNGQIKEQLKIQPNERWELSYDGSHWYGNMTTNLSKVFNNIMKSVRGLPLIATMQMTYFSTNKYFVD